MSRLRAFCVALMFVPVIIGASALGAAERQLSFAEAVSAAVRCNHDLRASRDALLAGKADIGIARGNLLPHIALEERASRTDNPPGVFMSKLNQQRFSPADFDIRALNSPRPVNDLQTMVSVDQALFAAPAYVGLEMAKKEYAAKEEDFGRKSEETIMTVAENYLQIYTAKEYLRVFQVGVNDAKEHLRIAESRRKNGLGLLADVLRARTAVIEAEQRVVTSEKNLSVAKRALGLLLGMDEGVDTAGTPPEPGIRELPHYENSALSSRRDLKAMQIRVENAKNGVRMANSKYLPTVGLHASYQWNDHNQILGSEGESWWLMGVLKWDLFDGTAREFERRKARHQQAEATQRLEGMSRYVSFKVTEAYLSAQEAKKNVELARAALTDAEEGRRLMRSRYENSLSPAIDLFDVQLALDHARANLVAKENAYRTAVIRLSSEGGTIVEDLELNSSLKGAVQ